MSYDNDEIFDPDAVEVDDSYDLLPNGKYALQASSVEVVEKDGGEKMMYKVEFEVIDGDFQGRKVFENINLRNPSAQAVNIGRQTLAKLCRAIGVGPFALHDAGDALCWKPFIGTVGVQKDKSGHYSDQNRVKKYEPYAEQQAPTAPAPRSNPSSVRSTQNGGSAPTQRQQPAPAAESQPRRAAAGGGGRPWDRPRQ